MCDDVWSLISAADRAMQPFRDATIDKWNNKVNASSGALGSGKFKTLNQSILSQTQQVLQDMDRLLRRTRVKRSAYRVIGELLHGPAQRPRSGEADDAAADGKRPSGGSSSAQAREEMDDEVPRPPPPPSLAHAWSKRSESWLHTI